MNVKTHNKHKTRRVSATVVSGFLVTLAATGVPPEPLGHADGSRTPPLGTDVAEEAVNVAEPALHQTANAFRDALRQFDGEADFLNGPANQHPQAYHLWYPAITEALLRDAPAQAENRRLWLHRNVTSVVLASTHFSGHAPEQVLAGVIPLVGRDDLQQAVASIFLIQSGALHRDSPFRREGNDFFPAVERYLERPPRDDAGEVWEGLLQFIIDWMYDIDPRSTLETFVRGLSGRRHPGGLALGDRTSLREAAAVVTFALTLPAASKHHEWAMAEAREHIDMMSDDRQPFVRYYAVAIMAEHESLRDADRVREMAEDDPDAYVRDRARRLVETFERDAGQQQENETRPVGTQ